MNKKEWFISIAVMVIILTMGYFRPPGFRLVILATLAVDIKLLILDDPELIEAGKENKLLTLLAIILGCVLAGVGFTLGVML